VGTRVVAEPAPEGAAQPSSDRAGQAHAGVQAGETAEPAPAGTQAGETAEPAPAAEHPVSPGGGLGEFLRHQRELARLSIREMARRAGVSDSYLSQVERGLYRPSASVLKAVADALELSAATLYARAGLLDDEVPEPALARPHATGAPMGSGSAVERAIRADRRLSPGQREALVEVYRAMTGPGA